MATYPLEVPGEVGEARLPSAKSSLKRNHSAKPTLLGKRSKLPRRLPTSLKKSRYLANRGAGRTKILESSVRPSFSSMEKTIRRGVPTAAQDVAIKTSPL